MTGIFIVIGVVIFLLLVLTPMGRTIGRSIKNLFIADAMKSPKAAKAVFLTAIEDANKKLSQVRDAHVELSGRLEQTRKEKESTTKETEDTVNKMERLVQSGGSDEDLALLNEKRMSLTNRINSLTNIIEELEPRVEQVKEAQGILESEVRKLKEQKELKIAEMETAKIMDDTYKKLSGIDTTATGKLLEQFNDNLASAQRRADGGKIAHDNKLETREANMNKRLSSIEGDDFINQLKAKHSNNSNG